MAKKRKKATPVEEPADEAPGWDAITTACEALYPKEKNPIHIAPALSPVFSGEGLIYGISAYKATKPNHWHLVTYGFSELYAKESDDPEVSGWGFELTFRLTRGREKQPPNWAFNFLMNLGSYVRRSGNPFGSGHAMDINGPSLTALTRRFAPSHSPATRSLAPSTRRTVASSSFRLWG